MKWMSVEDVLKEVKKIKEEAWDDDATHSDEDLLYFKVLEQIAAGNPHPKELAEAALKSFEIQFSRRYE